METGNDDTGQAAGSRLGLRGGNVLGRLFHGIREHAPASVRLALDGAVASLSGRPWLLRHLDLSAGLRRRRRDPRGLFIGWLLKGDWNAGDASAHGLIQHRHFRRLGINSVLLRAPRTGGTGLALRLDDFQRVVAARPGFLEADPLAKVVDVARLLHGGSNHLARERPGDAGRVDYLSLCVRPSPDLAHAGLALLVAGTGRGSEAGQEARTVLEVVDGGARPPEGATAPTEDIARSRSPASLRQALAPLLADDPGARA
jgi:hypothetical protein